MDKEQAAITLTEELAKNSGMSIIKDSGQKSDLKKYSYAFFQAGSPFVMTYQYVDSCNRALMSQSDKSQQAKGWCFSHDKRTENGNHTHYSSIEEAVAKKEGCSGANYFFINESLIDGKDYTDGIMPQDHHFFMTPYSIICENEQTQCKRLFYKNAHPRILGAMKTLRLTNFIDIFKEYSNLKSGNPAFLNLKIREFMLKVPYLRFDSSNETSTDKINDIASISQLNYNFEKLGIKSRLSTTEHRGKRGIQEYPNYFHRKNINKVTSEIESRFKIRAGKTDSAPFNGVDIKLLSEFYNFVFELPPEDGNIEANKLILQSNYTDLDYITILAEEYEQGKHFKEYFDCLGAEQQKEVGRSLQAISGNRPELDSFLWAKGFKDIKLDYMELYENNADEFIDYFSSRTQPEKKTILKNIINCDYTNKPVANWLDENELDLVREVGLDG